MQLVLVRSNTTADNQPATSPSPARPATTMKCWAWLRMQTRQPSGAPSAPSAWPPTLTRLVPTRRAPTKPSTWSQRWAAAAVGWGGRAGELLRMALGRRVAQRTGASGRGVRHSWPPQLWMDACPLNRHAPSPPAARRAMCWATRPPGSSTTRSWRTPPSPTASSEPCCACNAAVLWPQLGRAGGS